MDRAAGTMSWERLSADPAMLYRLRPPDDLLAEALDLAAERHERPPSLEMARLLEVLAGEPSVTRVLEVGRIDGVATLCLARGAPEAGIVSVGTAESDRAALEELFGRAGVGDRVRLLSGEPLAAVESLDGRFDRIHLSVGLSGAIRLIDRVLQLLAVGGLLSVEGVAVDDAADGEEEGRAAAARSVAGYLVMHPQLDTLVVPVGDGLAVARKRRPLVTELGGPY